MSKKFSMILCLVLVSIMLFSLTACGDKNKDKPNEPVNTPDIVDDNPGVNDPDVDDPDADEVSVTLSDVVTTLQNTYGDLYLPSEELDADTFNMMIGLDDEDTSEYYSEFYAAVPMIGTHVDKLFVVKTDDVEKMTSVFEDYMEKQKNEAFQYPMNVIKVANAVVTSYEDYVILFILGAYPDIPDGVDSDAYEVFYYGEMNSKGVEALNDLFETGVVPEFSTPVVETPEDFVAEDTPDIDIPDVGGETPDLDPGFLIEVPVIEGFNETDESDYSDFS